MFLADRRLPVSSSELGGFVWVGHASNKDFFLKRIVKNHDPGPFLKGDIEIVMLIPG